MAPPGGGTDGSAVRRLRVLRSTFDQSSAPTPPHSPHPTQCHGESEGISVLEPPAPGDQEQTAAIVAAFKRDGIVCIPGVFSDTECAALRGRIDRLFDQRPPLDPDSLTPVTAAEKRTPIGSYVIPKCYLVDRVLARLFAHPVIFSLMEAILGPDMQQCGNNSLRTTEGAHRAEQWHVDPPVWFPLPPEIEKHDPRIEMPIFWLTVQIAFSDVGPDDGPTQYVLGSHYSGREPPTEEPPVPADDERLNFDGRPPHTAVCKAGSIYLHHPQTWHRGTQNVSGKRRYLHQQQYGQAWFFGRFFTDVHQPGYDTPLDFADSGDEPDGLDDEKVAQVLGLRPASKDRPWKEGVRFD